MITVMVGMATENNLGYLVSLQMAKPQRLVLLQTAVARSRGFGKHLADYCAKHKIELVFQQLPDGGSVGAIIHTLDQLAAAYVPDCQFLCNLAGVLKLHNVALWEFFRQQPSNRRVVFANLQDNQWQEWSLPDGKLNEMQQALGEVTSLQGILDLYGLNVQAVAMKPKDVANNIKRLDNMRLDSHNHGSDKGTGSRFELWCADQLVRLMGKGKLPLVRTLYVQARICRGRDEDGFILAEYDMIIETSDNRFVLLECKTSNKNLTLKEVKSQKQLAAEWGGAFSEFALVMPIHFEGRDATEKIQAMALRGREFKFAVFYGPGKPHPAIKNAHPLEKLGEVLRLSYRRESAPQ